MPNRREKLSTIKEIIRMGVQGGFSLRKIARAHKISHTCASNYLAWFQSLDISWDIFAVKTNQEVDALFNSRHQSNNERLKHLEEIFPEVRKKLPHKGETLQRLWEGYKNRNTDAFGYSQFCYYFKEWNGRQDVWLRMEHKAGDKMLVDFAGQKLFLTDPFLGSRKEVEVFVAVLACSQYCYVEAVGSQGKEYWIQANRNALEYFGGVPAAIVPDNLKSAVTKASKYEPWMNETYLDFARHYGTCILPARPSRPTDKALVEGAVRLVYQRIYAVLRDEVFHDLDELNNRIWELLELHNNRHFQQKEGSRRELFEEMEKSSLMSLPVEPFVFKEYLSCTVWLNYHVKLAVDEHWYSVPFRYAKKKVKLVYTVSLVEIYYEHERIAMHPRTFGRHQYTTIPEHMPSHHKHVAEMSPERLLRHAGTIGPETRRMVEKILNASRHPEHGFNSCQGIIHLNRKYGNDRVEKACARAMTFGACGYTVVLNVLEKGLDMVVEEQERDMPVLDHENIRGSKFYQ